MADDYSQFTPVGGNAPAPAITPEDYFSTVQKIYPNAVFTGGGRSVQRNAAVGGAPNSMHLSDQAMDFQVPGVPSSEVQAQLKSAGLPMTEFLSEGHIGNQGAHLHVGWAPKGTTNTPVNDYSSFNPANQTNDYSQFTPVQGGAPQPNWLEKGIMDVANSPLIKGVSGTYMEGVTNGLFMQPVRAAMEGMGIGMDKLKAAYPGQTNDWYNTHLHNMYSNAVTQARVNAAQEAQSGQIQPDQPDGGRSLPNTLARGGQMAANFTSGILAAPQYLVAPGMGVGNSVAARIGTAGLINAGIGGASDAAAQGMDMMEGQKKDFDIQQNLTQAATGFALGAGLHGASEAAPVVSDFVKGLFKNRGVDTLPAANPNGQTSPLSTDHVQMNADDAQQYHELLASGSVDDIKGFFKGKNGPQPSWTDVNNWVSHRDATTSYDPLQDTHLQPDFNYEAEYNKQSQRQAVEDHITQQTQGWKNSPQFEVIHGPDDIQDPAIRSQAQAEDVNGDALGFLGNDGKVRVFSGRITDPDTANAVTYHEGLGHFGLSQQFGDKLDSTLGTLLDRNVGQFKKRVADWQQVNPGAYGGDRIRAAEEVLAEDSQNGQIKPSWADAVSASVRQFGRKMGLKLSYSDGEVNQILAMAHDAVINGKGRDVAANGFRSKYMFTGQKAKNFDPYDQSSMLASDGKVRNEISDRLAKLTGVKMGTLEGNLDHPALYDQYPQLRKLRVIHSNMMNQGMLGAYDPETRVMYLDHDLSKRGRLQTILHETQHAIQHIENTSGIMDDGVHMSDDDYANSPIENEARATENRLDMSPQERAANPAKFMRKNAIGEEQTDPELLDLVDRLKTDPRFWSDPDFRKNVIEMARTREPVDTSPKETPAPPKYKSEAEARAALTFMRKSQMASSSDYKADDLEGIYKHLDENYEPTTRSWEEDRRAALEAGFKPSQIKDLRALNPGDLSTRLYRLQSAANMADMKISELNKKLDSPDWSIGDQQQYLQTLADRNYLIERIKGDKSEIARALNVSKAASSYTNSTMEQVAEMLRDNNSGLAALADDPIKFMKFAKQVQAMLNQGNPKGAHALMQGVNKSYWEQYLNTFHMNMMLSALSTHFKAPIDMGTGIARDAIERVLAIPVGKLRELAVNMVGGTPLPGVRPEEVASNIYGIIKSVMDAEVYRRMAHAVKTGEGSYVGPNGKSVPTNMANTYGATSNPRIPGVSLPTDLISAQDTFFRSVAMNQNLYSLGAREARAQLGPKASWDDVMTMGSSIAHNPSAQMLGEAKDLTDRTLLLNSNSLNKALDKYRVYGPGLTPWQRGGRFVVSNLAPFIRVESNNLMNRVIQRSPLGFLDPYTRKQIAMGGANADIALTKIAYGTVLLGMSWMAADKTKNYLSGEGPDNVDKFKEKEAGGWSPRSVHENGRYNTSNTLSMSVNPFDQHNATATMVAGLREAYEKGANQGQVGQGIKLVLGSLMHELSSMTWVSDVAPLMEALDARGQTAGHAVNGFIGNEVRTWTPNILDQVARLQDPDQHDIVDPDSISHTIANEVQSTIPGVSKQLPVRYSVYGNPLPNGASVTGVHTMIPGLQGNGRTETHDPAERELDRLNTLIPGALITPVQRMVKLEDEEPRKLTIPEFENYQRLAGRAIVETVRSEMSTPAWQEMSDQDKVLEVRDIQTDMKKAAKEALFGQQQ